jgi:FlaA1/EpsC-like NDP-sugar epimerase
MKLNIFDYSAPFRVWMLIVLYTVQLAASLWVAYEVRFDFVVEAAFQHERIVVLLWLIPLEVILLALFHQLHPLLGYFSTPDLARVFHALFISTCIAGVVWYIWGEGYAPPRGVIALNFIFALVGLTGSRLFLRASRESLAASTARKTQRARCVGIIGAGDAGAVLAHELTLKPGLGLDPVAFFDDDQRKWHSRVHDIPVIGPPEKLLELKSKLQIEQAIIAMPSAPAKRVGEIVRLLGEAHLECRTIPSMDQLALGQVKASQLRNVEVQDLLGRERVELDTEEIRKALQHRVVLVTGAGGSIGSELCRQIASCHPRCLLLLDRAEPAAFQIEQELIGLGNRTRIRPLVGDITDGERMDQIFSEYRPELVFHTAAHKHVPMMESQPAEAIKNNSAGTAQLAELALNYSVDRFVLISSDKAINPTSVMGATKRLAEMYIQALHAQNPARTKFMAVRFGNVLGSSGSVIPLFRRQIADGGPVRVTHPEMTRYFMTIPEACMLVLQSAVQGAGGEIFVLDMGKPVRIVDLARQMIELSGLKPDLDIQIEFIGMRPGEKLFEELSHKAENVTPTGHAKILRLNATPPDLSQIKLAFKNLREHFVAAEPNKIKLMLKTAVPEYTPHLPPAVENLISLPTAAAQPSKVIAIPSLEAQTTA